MILVDMNQIGVASVMMHLNITKRDSVDVPLVRHMILNSLRMYRQMFHEEYGELESVMIPATIGDVISFQNIKPVERKPEKLLAMTGMIYLIV